MHFFKKTMLFISCHLQFSLFLKLSYCNIQLSTHGASSAYTPKYENYNIFLFRVKLLHILIIKILGAVKNRNALEEAGCQKSCKFKRN